MASRYMARIKGKMIH